MFNLLINNYNKFISKVNIKLIKNNKKNYNIFVRDFKYSLKKKII